LEKLRINLRGKKRGREIPFVSGGVMAEGKKGSSGPEEKKKRPTMPFRVKKGSQVGKRRGEGPRGLQ